MKYLISFILIVLLWSCAHHSGTEKHLRHSGNVMDVKELVQEIQIDSPLISGFAHPYILGDYFILSDSHSPDNLLFIFDKKDFSYIAGGGRRGEGPDEITNLGELIPDVARQRLYAADYGKMQILGYDLDSILLCPGCVPKYRFDLNKAVIPVRYSYVNDTLCFACCITAEPGKHFQESLVTWNMQTGDINPLISGHPEVKRKRIRYAASLENDLIAVGYEHHDLLSIYDCQGNLEYNIYGPDWDNATSNAMIYYWGSIVICNNRIIVGYSGERNPEAGNINITNLLVYDLDGNYMKTLKVGYNIVLFCYDSTYNRLIMTLDDEIQFGYLDLDGII